MTYDEAVRVIEGKLYATYSRAWSTRRQLSAEHTRSGHRLPERRSPPKSGGPANTARRWLMLRSSSRYSGAWRHETGRWCVCAMASAGPGTRLAGVWGWEAARCIKPGIGC